MSSLEAAQRSLLSEDHRERSGLSQPEVPKLMARFPGSFKETSESFAQQYPKHLSQGVAGTHRKEGGRNNSKDPVLLGYGSKGHKIHYSGPLVVPSGNMDQMMKDHDRQIQEAVRRKARSYNPASFPSPETAFSVGRDPLRIHDSHQIPISSELLPFSSSLTLPLVMVLAFIFGVFQDQEFNGVNDNHVLKSLSCLVAMEAGY
ncbi:hypothetical protein OIU84_024371 [Salix udensis]|uniref:Uncharacterized protein n=1 Tax=Salix udensis TaxID=889485 RepID=A0AAD6KH58_9ROSI|nr:hypothetical protein OIU84_024371 [Salix udensis]